MAGGNREFRTFEWDTSPDIVYLFAPETGDRPNLRRARLQFTRGSPSYPCRQTHDPETQTAFSPHMEFEQETEEVMPDMEYFNIYIQLNMQTLH